MLEAEWGRVVLGVRRPLHPGAVRSGHRSHGPARRSLGFRRLRLEAVEHEAYATLGGRQSPLGAEHRHRRSQRALRPARHLPQRVDHRRNGSLSTPGGRGRLPPAAPSFPARERASAPGSGGHKAEALHHLPPGPGHPASHSCRHRPPARWTDHAKDPPHRSAARPPSLRGLCRRCVPYACCESQSPLANPAARRRAPNARAIHILAPTLVKAGSATAAADAVPRTGLPVAPVQRPAPPEGYHRASRRSARPSMTDPAIAEAEQRQTVARRELSRRTSPEPDVAVPSDVPTPFGATRSERRRLRAVARPTRGERVQGWTPDCGGCRRDQ